MLLIVRSILARPKAPSPLRSAGAVQEQSKMRPPSWLRFKLKRSGEGRTEFLLMPGRRSPAGAAVFFHQSGLHHGLRAVVLGIIGRRVKQAGLGRGERYVLI